MSTLPTRRVVDDGTYACRLRALSIFVTLLALGVPFGGCSKSHGAPPVTTDDVTSEDAEPEELDPEHDAALPEPDADVLSDPDADAAIGVVGCAADAECSAGYCVDGVCCEQSCAGSCLACTEEKTGQPDGVCADLLESADPDGACAAAVVCVSESCGPYRCNEAGDDCLTSCAESSNCAVGHLCSSLGTCEALTSASVLWVTTWGGDPNYLVDVTQLGSVVVDSKGNATVVVHCQGLSAETTGLQCDAYSSVNLVGVSSEGARSWLRYVRFGRQAWVNIMANDDVVYGVNAGRLAGECCSWEMMTRSASSGKGSGVTVSDFDSGRPGLLWASSDASSVTAFVVAQPDLFSYAYGPPVPGPLAFVRFRPPHEVFDSRPWPSDAPLKSDPSGGLWYVGTSEQVSSFGCPAGASADSLYVAQISDTGACSWSHDFGATVLKSSYTFDAEGALLLAATVSGPADFGAGSPAPVGPVDLVIAKLGSDGSVIWSRRFGGPTFDGDAKISTSSHGTVYVGAAFAGSIDFGAGPVLADAGANYLVKLSSAGLTLGQHQFHAQGGLELAATPDGDVLVLSGDPVVGGPGVGIDFGGGFVFPAGGGRGLALAKLRF